MNPTQELTIVGARSTVSCATFRLACISALIVAIWAALPNSARAQAPDLVLTNAAETQLDSLASRVSEKIKRSKRGRTPDYVLVFDFLPQSPESSSLLGTLLADRFTDMLSHHGNGIVVMDREVLKNYLKKNLMDTEDLAAASVYLSIAHDLGATDLIRANLSEGGNQTLRVSIERQGSSPPFHDEAQFLASKDLEDLLVKPAPSNHRVSQTIPPEQGVIVMGAGQVQGVRGPTCITCTNPQYTEAARERKFSNGTVIFSALITTDGQVTSVYVMRGLPFGLTERALMTIKDWKLKPAMKDGMPVPVRVDITITFRLF